MNCSITKNAQCGHHKAHRVQYYIQTHFLLKQIDNMSHIKLKAIKLRMKYTVLMERKENKKGFIAYPMFPVSYCS